MNYNELIDNSDYNFPNQISLNESNYERYFSKIFCCNNNKNEFEQESPSLLYQNNIEINFIEN